MYDDIQNMMDSYILLYYIKACKQSIWPDIHVDIAVDLS